MMTVHVTHSPLAYDRSPISVDRSLRLPPRSPSQLEEDDEEEAETCQTSDNKRSDSTCLQSSFTQNWIGSMGGSDSVLDGF